MRSRVYLPLLLLVACRVALAAEAPAYPNAVEGDFTIKDYKFATGESLPEVKMHYRTFGTPMRDGQGRINNAVLLLHGTTGSGAQFLSPGLAGELFGPGQALDATKFYLILPDSIGRGKSSRPSESLRMKFPRYGYVDAADLQYRLVSEKLGVSHLRLILGTSMGGMHAWVWATRHPEFVDALMPIACQPAPITGRNLVWRRIIVDSIKSDPAWNQGNYTAQPHGWTSMLPVFRMLIDSPQNLEESIPNIEKADSFVAGAMADAAKTFDANDMVYALDSSRDYDPTAELDKVKARVVAVNFSDDELNPVELKIMEREMAKVKGGRQVMLPPPPKSKGHQNLGQAGLWKQYVGELLP